MEYTVQGYSQVTVLEYLSRKPVLFFPEAHFANVGIEGTAVVGSGGQQSLDLIAWNDGNKGKFILYSPTFSMKFLELAAGSDLQEKTESFTKSETIEIQSNTIVLNDIPDIGKLLKIYKLEADGKTINSELTINTIDDNTITLMGNNDGWVLVVYEVSISAEIIDIGKSVNKGYYSVLGTSVLYSKEEDKEELYFEFPKVSIHNNFDIKTLNARNPDSYFVLTCEALADEKFNKSLLRIIKRKQG